MGRKEQGRPKGSRDAITKEFIDALTEDFKEHKSATLKAAREKNPCEYLRVIASVVPKDQNVRIKDDVGAVFLDALKGLTTDAELAKENARLKVENAALKGDDAETVVTVN